MSTTDPYTACRASGGHRWLDEGDGWEQCGRCPLRRHTMENHRSYYYRTIPRPVPREERSPRIVLCRRCAKPTGYPGAAYCDDCLPDVDPSSILLTPADRSRMEKP